jgi:hypothetical protein
MGGVPSGIQKHQTAKYEQVKKGAIAQKINKLIHRARSPEQWLLWDEQLIG